MPAPTSPKTRARREIGGPPDFLANLAVSQPPCSSYAARVLLSNLTVGTTYYYVCGSELSTLPWSQVFTFTFSSGSVRPGGPVYAVVADFGFYNAESLEKLMASACT